MLRAMKEQLNRIERVQTSILRLLTTEGTEITMTLDDIKNDVAAEKTVVDSTVTLLNGLSAQLAAAGQDPQKLADLKQAIDDQTAELANAVAANTPAA